MANYTYKEIKKVLLSCGFVEINNDHGSHQVFFNPVTGFAQSVPKQSDGMVAPGTAESILEYAVAVARISDINIGGKKYNLSNNTLNFIKKCHSKIKENIMFLFPKNVRKQNNLETKEDVLIFLQQKIKQANKYKELHKNQTEEMGE